MNQPTLQNGRRPVRAATVSSGHVGGPPRSSPIPLALAGLASIVVVVATAMLLRGSHTVDEMDAFAAATEPSSSGRAVPNPTTVGEPSGAAPVKPAPSAAPMSTSAPAGDLDDARAMGLARLGPLAERYPRDPAVIKALMLAYATDNPGSVGSVRAARQLVDLSPQYVNDDEVRRVLLRAANGTPEATDGAVEALQHMGPGGLDVLYELIGAQGVGKYSKEKISALFADPAVMKDATPALRIANDLRMATACKRKPLLQRAREVGDARSLHFLKPLQSTSGCGIFSTSDCYGCLGSRKQLNEAIDAINARAK